MGATHFLMKTLPRVSTEMALHVLAYNLTRVMNIMASNWSCRRCGIVAAACGCPLLKNCQDGWNPHQQPESRKRTLNPEK